MKITPGFKVRGFILAAAFSAGLGFATSAAAQVQHSYLIDLNNRTVKELGSPGHLISVEAINHAGQLVGETSGMGFITGPDGEGIRNLVSLGGNFSRALGINDSGQVVGEFRTATGADHAFITGPNGIGMRDLDTLGRDNSRATGINSAGQVVGVRTTTDNSLHAFITGPNGVGMRDLGGIPAGADSAAFAINDAGQVLAVFAPPEGGDFVSFITGPDGAGTQVVGRFGGRGDVATDMNASGQVAAGAGITGPNGMGITALGNLGRLGTDAEGINDAGQVVGNSPTVSGNIHAFVTGPNGVGMTDLNSLDFLPDGLLLTNAVDINNRGQIIATSVPEPETYALLLAGLGLVGFMTRRKKAKNPG